MQRFLLFFFLLCFSLSISRSAFGRGAAEAHCFFVPPANVPYDFFSRFTAKQVWIDSLVRILILILGSGLAFFNSDRTEKKIEGVAFATSASLFRTQNFFIHSVGGFIHLLPAKIQGPSHLSTYACTWANRFRCICTVILKLIRNSANDANLRQINTAFRLKTNENNMSSGSIWN